MKKKPELRFLHLDITVSCNLKCKYCFYSEYNNVEKIKKEIEVSRLEKLIDEAIDMGCQKIILSGGEIYNERPRFERIASYCHDRNLKILIITNGTLLQIEDFEFLVRIKDSLEEIKVSFDGVAQDIVRGEKTSEKVINNLKRMKELQLPITVNTIISKYNIHNMLEMYEWIKSLEPLNWRIDLPFKLGNYVENEKNLQVSDLEETFQILSMMLEKYLQEKPDFGLWMFEIYRPGLENFEIAKQDKCMHPCTYNKRNLGIRGNGEVTPCSRFLNLELGNIREKTIRQVKESEKFKRFWNIKIEELVACRECKYIYICGGGCRANAISELGDVMQRDPMACIRMPLFEKYIVPLFSEETRKGIMMLIEEATIN